MCDCGLLSTTGYAGSPRLPDLLPDLLAGTLVFAAIQGIIVQVMTQGDPDETNFRQSLDALNFMMVP